MGFKQLTLASLAACRLAAFEVFLEESTALGASDTIITHGDLSATAVVDHKRRASVNAGQCC